MPQLADEAELDRCRSLADTADRDVLVGRVERRSGLLGHRRLGEPGVALNAAGVRLKTTFGIRPFADAALRSRRERHRVAQEEPPAGATFAG